MTQEYKRNHTIPRCMLNYWVDSSGIFPGVHVYDIHEKRLFKSESRGKRAFSFAIVNNLHIVEVNGKRATSVERWLSSLEGTLAQFLKLVHNHEPINLTEQKEVKLAMALLALETRSEYDHRQIKNYLTKNQKNNKSDTKALTLENLIDYVTYIAHELMPLELIIVTSSKHSWIISDRPFLHWEGLSHRLLVLTNKVVLGFRKSPHGSSYQYIDAPSVYEINRGIALQARSWIAADSLDNIQKYIPIFDESAYAMSKQNDSVEEYHPSKPIRGWKIFD